MSMRFASLILGFALLSGGGVLAQGTGAPPAAADALAQSRADVTQREAAQHDLARAQEKLLAANQRTNREIDALKAQAEEPARDAKLQSLLALAQSRAQELEKLEAQLRAAQDALQRARQTLAQRCDQALAAPSLPDSQRVELIRLRAVQIAALVQPARPVGAVGAPGTAANPLDGPRELEEKADLLRDSSDKLRKEARRIATRIDDLERRRHLRERSSALDEDWFSESTSNRRFARTTTQPTTAKSESTGAQNPAFAGPPAGAGGTADRGPEANDAAANPSVETATVLRNLVDPATLEELRRADRGDDVDRQIKALRRAQSELDSLAGDLDKKGKSLSRRAQEIRIQK